MSGKSEQPEVRFGLCCFCGQDIASSETDPCEVTVETANKMWQVWYCHGDCFKSRITKDLDLEPAHF